MGVIAAIVSVAPTALVWAFVAIAVATVLVKLLPGQ